MPENLTPERQQEKPSMNEGQTIAFLRENGVQNVGDDWQPGQPLLYVLDERVRTFYNEIQRRPLSEVASVVRIDEPSDLCLVNKDPGSGKPFIPGLFNKGGKVDYYAINPDTKKAILVGTGYANRRYIVRKENVFVAADTFFPKSSSLEHN